MKHPLCKNHPKCVKSPRIPANKGFCADCAKANNSLPAGVTRGGMHGLTTNLTGLLTVDTRRTKASSVVTASSVLKQLALDFDSKVQLNVANNFATPGFALEHLVETGNNESAAAAERTLQAQRSVVGGLVFPEWLDGSLSHHMDGKEADLPITAGFVFVTAGNKIALTRVVKRGWDLPGGHVDPGETASYAAVREVFEETDCVVDEDNVKPVGYGRVSQTPSEKYPYEVSAMQYYRTETTEQALTPDLECDAAEWVSISELEERCGDKVWFPMAAHLFSS